jgi:hypothetical protein
LAGGDELFHRLLGCEAHVLASVTHPGRETVATATEPDAVDALHLTPSHPEYPAAHTTVGVAPSGLHAVVRHRSVPLGFKEILLRFATRRREILAEEGNARVWGGMHWRHSTEVGTKLGRRVGKYTATHLLKPLDD